MSTTKSKNILSMLEQYYNELKSYSDILKHLAESKTILGHELKERDRLRERLVRKTGMLKTRIIEVTSKQYYEQLMSKYDMWDEAFNPTFYLPSNRTAIAFCITATNEAIGKLESDIRLGIRDKQGNVIGEPQAVDTQERRKDISEVPSALFDKMQLHPKVVKVSESLFKTGNYAQAIFEAFKAVNNYVKDKTGLTLDGTNLMEKVFNENKPILKLNELLDPSDKNEQKGFKYIFMGSQMGIRNPKAHENVKQEDPIRTLEYLSIASLLMRRIDESKLVKLNIKE